MASSAGRKPVRVVFCSPWLDALWVLIPTLFGALQYLHVLWVIGLLLVLMDLAEGGLSSTLDNCNKFAGCMSCNFQ